MNELPVEVITNGKLRYTESCERGAAFVAQLLSRGSHTHQPLTLNTVVKPQKHLQSQMAQTNLLIRPQNKSM